MWDSATPTRGLLAGLVAFSTFMVFISWGETPAFEQSAVVVFILTAVSGIVADRLLSVPVGTGYAVSFLTGVLATSFALLLVFQAVRPDYPGSAAVSVFLPLSYSGLGILLIIVSIIPPIRGSTGDGPS